MLRLSTLLAALLTVSAAAQVVPGSSRIYYIGNSITDHIHYADWADMAATRAKQVTWGRHMIPGSPLDLLYSYAAGPVGITADPFGFPQNAFTNYAWDAISLQPGQRGIDEDATSDCFTIQNYMRMAAGRSPDVQVFLYCGWLGIPDNMPNPTADYYTTTWLQSYTRNNWGRDMTLKLADRVNRDRPISKKALIVPIGEVMYALNLKMKDGKVPGYTKIWELFNDGIHFNNVGAFIAAMTMYACVFNANPEGLAVPRSYAPVADTVARIIQSTVWDVVNQYSTYTGVTQAQPASITVSPRTMTLLLNERQPLSANITPENVATFRPQWSSSQTSVATVDLLGMVRGIAAGSATITARAGTVSHTATITVSTDTVKAVYLSDLSWTDATNGYGPVEIDMSIGGDKAGDGSTLTLNGTTYPKGLGVHAPSQIIYDLTNSYSAFRADIGLDDGAGGCGGVIFEVYADGVRVHRSAELGPSSPTQHLDIAIPGVKRLELRVLEGADPWCDHADWADARLIYNPGAGVAVSAVSVAPAEATLMVGDTRVIIAQVLPANATNPALTWSSGNTAVATVDAGGVVTAVAVGATTITATTVDGGRTARCAVTVTPNAMPIAVLTATPLAGNAPLTVTFSSDGSWDPDSGTAGDYVLGFDWEFGDGTPGSYLSTVHHTYTQPGTYTARLRVMDNHNLRGAWVQKTITVGGVTVTPPSAHVSAPTRAVPATEFQLDGRLRGRVVDARAAALRGLRDFGPAGVRVYRTDDGAVFSAPRNLDQR